MASLNIKLLFMICKNKWCYSKLLRCIA